MKYLIFSMLFLLLSGCASTLSKPQRVVKDNILYSTSMPKFKIELNKDYKLYSSNKNLSDTASRAGSDSEKYNNESYVFLKNDSTNRAQSGIIIQISRAPSGQFWDTDIFFAHKNKFYSNSVTVGDMKFQEAVEFFTSSSERYVARIIGRNYGAGNDIQVKIYYGEPVKHFNRMAYNDENHGEHHWLNRDSYDQKRHREFNNFLERANRAFRISEITSADIAMLESPGPSLSVPVTSQPQGATEQLKNLMDLYVEGFITLEEYNSKRKEILDRM